MDLNIFELIIGMFLSVFSAFITVFGYNRQQRKDAVAKESRVKELEMKVNYVEIRFREYSPVQVATMEQYVKELGKRVDKLDSDVEKKLDQLSDKIDSLTDKLNELLLRLMDK